MIAKVGIITVSDRASRGERDDESGLLLRALVEGAGAEVAAYRVLPDEEVILAHALRDLADTCFCDLIFTTGGTGLSPRDHTPEATRAVIDREIPGIAEALRASAQKKTPFAMLSRAVAGVRGRTLIINLPGSPGAVQDAFQVLKPVLKHAVELIQGRVKDCRDSHRREHREKTWTEQSPISRRL